MAQPKITVEQVDQNIAAAFYPVGAIFLSTNGVDPATSLGFGTWTQISQGRTLIGEGTGGGATYSNGDTGGDKDAIIPTHNHSGTTTSAGNHAHTFSTGLGESSGGTHAVRAFNPNSSQTTSSAGSHTHSLSINNAGESAVDKNMQPYLVVYIWERTA